MNITATVPEKMLQIQGVTRLVQATNDEEGLRIYLTFAQPVLNSSEQILSALTATDAVLTPTNRSTLGKRRFGYVVSSSSSYLLVHTCCIFPVQPRLPALLVDSMARPCSWFVRLTDCELFL